MKGYFPHPLIHPLRCMPLGGYLWLYAELLLILLAGTVHSPLLVCSRLFPDSSSYDKHGEVCFLFSFLFLQINTHELEESHNQMVVLFKFGGGTSYCFPNGNTNFPSLQLHSGVLFHILISIHSCVVFWFFFSLFWVLLEVLRPLLALFLLLLGFNGNHTWYQGQILGWPLPTVLFL